MISLGVPIFRVFTSITVKTLKIGTPRLTTVVNIAVNMVFCIHVFFIDYEIIRSRKKKLNAKL